MAKTLFVLRRRFVCGSFFAFALAAGCSSSSVPPPQYSATATPSASPSARPSNTSTPQPSPSASNPPTSTGQFIYVANTGNNSVTVYAQLVNAIISQSSVATIEGANTGLSSPEGIAVDSSGKIYVTNAGNNSLTIFPPNPHGVVNESPLATIAGSSTGLYGPDGVALDANGKIYVSNAGTNADPGSVTVYAANPTGTLDEAPLSTVQVPNETSPQGIALDRSGEIYVPSFAQSVFVFASPSGTSVTAPPIANIEQPEPHGVALDAGGNIYIANVQTADPGFGNNVEVYPPNPIGHTTSGIIGSIEGVPYPYGIALDSVGNVYVTCNSGCSVSAPETPVVLVYRANSYASGSDPVLYTITGAASGLNSPYGIAVH